MTKLIALQMNSGADVQDNLRHVDELLQSLNIDQECLVVLPECFACFGGGDNKQLAIAEQRDSGPIQSALCALAKQYKVWLVAGSMPLQTPNQEKFTASSLLIDSDGNIQAEYQKIHLFDVQVADSTGRYYESRLTQAGASVVVADTPFGKLGMAICYDIRFPGLFMAMSQEAQLDIIALPAAFTYTTGEAHWHSLLAARAIENQCYVVAANQTGIHGKRQTFGHSCIMSPWGETLAQLDKEIGAIEVSTQADTITQIRQNMPVYHHNKFRSHLV